MKPHEIITLFIAVWGAVTGTLGLVLGRRESKWKRRHAGLEPLHPMLERLGKPLANTTDPQIVKNLFSLTVAADLDALRTGESKLPDRRMRRHLRALIRSVTAFRGGQQPEQADGSAAGLTRAQVDELKTAKRSLAKVERRLAVTAQKGHF